MLDWTLDTIFATDLFTLIWITTVLHWQKQLCTFSIYFNAFIQWWYTLPESSSSSLKTNGLVQINFPFRVHRQRPILQGANCELQGMVILPTHPKTNYWFTWKSIPLMKRKRIICRFWGGSKMWVLGGCMMKLLVPMFHWDELVDFFFAEAVRPSWGNFGRRRIAKFFWGSLLPRIGWFVGVLMS